MQWYGLKVNEKCSCKTMIIAKSNEVMGRVQDGIHFSMVKSIISWPRSVKLSSNLTKFIGSCQIQLEMMPSNHSMDTCPVQVRQSQRHFVSTPKVQLSQLINDQENAVLKLIQGCLCQISACYRPKSDHLSLLNFFDPRQNRQFQTEIMNRNGFYARLAPHFEQKPPLCAHK